MKQLSFDGKGINDADEFATRLATFTSPAYAEQFGPVFGAAPALRECLSDMLAYFEGYERDYNGGEPLPVFERARNLLTACEG